ncbi:ATP-dependent DNA helicase PIF1 [Paramuricea clavata]|uniref:ATP-dependent DNA helicase n=1 Tax=Paramuricea clavata TaxID=317549 RepID=A0A6S7FR47_PARCT|nr:ATP-dependent DNA helicase PIF1 [Paramuricea clavata]
MALVELTHQLKKRTFAQAILFLMSITTKLNFVQFATHFKTAYAKENVPDWFDKLQSVVQNQQQSENLNADEQPENTCEEWMIISDLPMPFSDSRLTNAEIAYDWNGDRANYSEQQIGEMPVWIKNMREGSDQVLHENIDVDTFSEMQELAYNIVRSHFNDISSNRTPLVLIINGVAGTESLHSIDYIIIDEYSMLGQVTFGWIDRRLKQSSGLQDKLLGDKSVILCGDPAQLPPVADKPLYHAIPTNGIREQGYLTYKMFDNVVKLNVNQCVPGT